jgi:hypothetical protein
MTRQQRHVAQILGWEPTTEEWTALEAAVRAVQAQRQRRWTWWPEVRRLYSAEERGVPGAAAGKCAVSYNCPFIKWFT